MRKRHGDTHDPAHFIYHYLGCAPVEVISHDSAEDAFVVDVAGLRWDVALAVDPSTFKTVIAAMVAKADQIEGSKQGHLGNLIVRAHGAAVLQACREFCEVNLLRRQRGRR